MLSVLMLVGIFSFSEFHLFTVEKPWVGREIMEKEK
jgi:hypothetical protein